MSILAATSLSLTSAAAQPPISGQTSDIIQSLAPQLRAAVLQQQQIAALHALKFGKLHERFDSITSAEANTYAWLLPDADDGSSAVELSAHLVHAKQTFLDWLATGSGFFYTSGKPGAGKSTLMKFVCRHPQFQACAARWAGGAELVVGRFFFWKPGQPEQKSISGMLRGLLYSILEARPDTTAIALPELCDSLLSDEPFAVTDADVKAAFESMLLTFSQNKKYAIMLVLDGLDEFDGDHADLLALMQSWVSQYPSTIKICVSSREYGVFEDFFASYPKFRLHELTKDDMALLIASRFGASKAFQKLPGHDLAAITPLITSRAEGVFLWVILATSAVEDGMEAGDIQNAGELEGCVRRFPTELDDLLVHLHKSVGEHFRPWAYKAITLVHFAQFKMSRLLAAGNGYPGVGLMDFMLLDEATATWNLTMFAPRSDSKAADVESRLEAARRKVLCRPKGFLAVSNLLHVRGWPANGTDKLYMTFTHRSVVEYIESDQSLGLMGKYTSGFDPLFALASTDLAALRFSQPPSYPLLKDKEQLPQGGSGNPELSDILAESLVQRFNELIESAAALDQGGSSRFLSILDALGDAVKRHLTLTLPLQRIRLAPEEDSPHQLLISLTLGNNVFEYSDWKRKQPMQASPGKKCMSTSLFQAFQSMIRQCGVGRKTTVSIRGLEGGKPIRVIKSDASPSEPRVPFDRLLRVLEEFFENGLDVNRFWHGTWQGTTTAESEAWTCWQAMLWAVSCGDMPYGEKNGEILELLQKHDAEKDTQVIACPPHGPFEIEDMEPSDGWYYVTPFTDVSAASGSKTMRNEENGRDQMLPGVLMHESHEVIKRARPNGGLKE